MRHDKNLPQPICTTTYVPQPRPAATYRNHDVPQLTSCAQLRHSNQRVSKCRVAPSCAQLRPVAPSSGIQNNGSQNVRLRPVAPSCAQLHLWSLPRVPIVALKSPSMNVFRQGRQMVNENKQNLISQNTKVLGQTTYVYVNLVGATFFF